MTTTINTFLARRYSRRSLLATVGRMSVVVAGGGVVSLARPAVASATICNSGHSVGCQYLDGWNQNSCPPDSCDNNVNYWTDCTVNCPSPAQTWFYDCCSRCKSTNTHCKPCHCDNSGPSSCCYCTDNSTLWCGTGCTPDQNCTCCRYFRCHTGGPAC